MQPIQIEYHYAGDTTFLRQADGISATTLGEYLAGDAHPFNQCLTCPRATVPVAGHGLWVAHLPRRQRAKFKIASNRMAVYPARQALCVSDLQKSAS